MHMLELRQTEVTASGLKELAGLTSLQWLILERTAVTDEGLKELARLESLRRLSWTAPW